MEVKTLKRYQHKSITQLIKIADRHFHEFIRLRDSQDGWFKCISCSEIKSTDVLHASHYMSAGLHSSTRFDPENVFGSCSKCNTHLHGNLLEYRQRLVARFGEDKVRQIEIKAKMRHKFDKYGLIDTIETYKQKVKELKKPSIVKQVKK